MIRHVDLFIDLKIKIKRLLCGKDVPNNLAMYDVVGPFETRKRTMNTDTTTQTPKPLSKTNNLTK